MFIVDAQIHIWAANTPDRPWAVLDPPYVPHRPQPFTKDDLLREMDAAGVHRTVLVPNPLDHFRNDLHLKAARLHPDRLAVMGLLDIDAPGALDQLASWRQQPGMLGLRVVFRLQGDPHNDQLWTALESSEVPVMVMIHSAKLAPVKVAAKRHPGLKIVLDHLGLEQPFKDEKAFTDLDHLLGMAECPNVAVKASSLPSYTTDSYPFRRLHPYIRRVYDAFGPRRMFWGSDLTRLPCSYRQCIDLFTEELKWLTPEDKEWIMGKGLCEWIGWPLPRGHGAT